MVSARQLRGFPKDLAEKYGKPHIGAYYRTSSVKSHTMDGYQPCAVCGAPATNVHHDPPLRNGHGFELESGGMLLKLRPALFALCGSGTTGCHNGFHGGGRFTARWVWDDLLGDEAWWTGDLLEILEPHSPGLYRFGHWEIEDRKTGQVIRHYGD